MKLPFTARKTEWKADWTWSRSTPIWLMRLSDDGRILLELRDQDTQQAWFACLDEQSGSALWDDLALEEPWWVGLEDMDSGRLYLHGFRKPDMPQHKGIWTYDLQTGSLLWSAPDMTFFLARGGSLYAVREMFEGLRFTELDAASGAPVRELGDDDGTLEALRREMNEEDRFREYSYPEMVALRDLDEEQRSACALLSERAVDGRCELLRYGNVLLVTWHEAAGTTYDQFVGAVLMHERRVAMRLRINTGLPAENMDSFFVKSGTMYCIRDRHELNAFHLGRDEQ